MNTFVIAIACRNVNLRASTVQIGHLDPALDMPFSYIERCLWSAVQAYPAYRIVIADDASTDGTYDIIREVTSGFPISVTVVRNKQRLGVEGSHYQMARDIADDEIIVVLDGDDQLANRHVLGKLNKVYSDPNVWLTYGSFGYDEQSRSKEPGADWRGFAAPIEATHTRHVPFSCTHLRTYKRWLFNRIQREDLALDAHPFSLIPDMRMMYPMIEMAGPQHTRFIPDILYLYNIVNPYRILHGPGAWPTDTPEQRLIKNAGVRQYGHEHILLQDEINAEIAAFRQQRIYPRLTKEKDFPTW